MSDQFDTLNKFLMEQMTMYHAYQPVMIRELLQHCGSASVTQIAQAILDRDPTQIEYFSEAVETIEILISIYLTQVTLAYPPSP